MSTISIPIQTRMETLATANIVPPKQFNIEYVFRPVYFYSRFSGLWTFSIARDSTGMAQRARIGFCDILWPIFVICLNFISAFYTYKTFMAERMEYANFTRFIAENLFQMGCFLFVAIGIVLNMIHRRRLVDVLRKFNTFDNEVSQFFRRLFHETKMYLNFCVNKHRYLNSASILITNVVIDMHGCSVWHQHSWLGFCFR